MFWKEWHFADVNWRRKRLGLSVRAIATIVYAVLFAYGAVVAGWSLLGDRRPFGVDVEDYLMLAPCLGLVALLVSIRRATLSFANERQRDSWMLVLATPLTGWEIVRAKLLGAMKPLLLTMVLILPFYLLQFVAVKDHNVLTVVWPFVVLFFGWFITTVGLYMSLVCGTARGAFVATSTIIFLMLFFMSWPLSLAATASLPRGGGASSAIPAALVVAFFYTGFGSFSLDQCVTTFDQRFGRMPSDGTWSRQRTLPCASQGHVTKGSIDAGHASRDQR